VRCGSLQAGSVRLRGRSVAAGLASSGGRAPLHQPDELVADALKGAPGSVDTGRMGDEGEGRTMAAKAAATLTDDELLDAIRETGNPILLSGLLDEWQRRPWLHPGVLA
jgi:hypothetical protein